jgi:ornithine lipid hydroxylase
MPLLLNVGEAESPVNTKGALAVQRSDEARPQSSPEEVGVGHSPARALEVCVRSAHSGWVLSTVVFVSYLGGAMWVALAAIARGWPAPLVVVGLSALVVPIVVALERFQTYTPAWKPRWRDLRVDGLHLFISQLAPGEVYNALSHGALLWWATWCAERVGTGLWPNHWPLALQVAAALLLGEFFQYWFHRCCHESDLFWRIHATHHSSQRLYWLAAVRFHPLDNLFAAMMQFTPMVILGASENVLALFTLFVNIHGLFQHCNFRVRLGPLNYVLAMTEVHRWHHSRDMRYGNGNYGGYLIVWDLVFGTYRVPWHLKLQADQIGLHGMDNFPQTWWGQVLSPFRWGRLKAEAERSSPPAEPAVTVLPDARPEPAA